MNNKTDINPGQMYRDFLARLEPSYRLCYVDSYDEVPAKLIQQCLDARSGEPLTSEPLFDEERRYYADYYLKELAQTFIDKPYSYEKLEEFTGSDEWDSLLNEIEDRDTSAPLRELLSQSTVHVRIMLHSNYDCWLPVWETRSLYLRDSALDGILAMLSLNPSRVKAAAMKLGMPVSGRWPDLPSREGKEVVDYEAFVKNLQACPNYGLWTFFGRFRLTDLLDADFDPASLTIPKGTVCSMYNDWNGGGSTYLIHTIRDIPVRELVRRGARRKDTARVYVDEKGCSNGYASGEVYGQYLSDEYALVA